MIIFLSFRSNPFYEPKPTSPNNLVTAVPEGEAERRVKRKAPAPPTLPAKPGVSESPVAPTGRERSTSPKVTPADAYSFLHTVCFQVMKAIAT